MTPTQGKTSTWGSYESIDDRRRMGAVLGRLHAATEYVPSELPRREDFALPSRAALVEALHDLERPWSNGPFAEPARPHGEPHRANVIRDPRGGVHLVDWDTTLIAPRERDLRMVLDRDLTGWDEYVGVAGAVSLNQEAIELYRRWWDLADIGIYTALFRRPHERMEDTIASWKNLSGYFSVL